MNLFIGREAELNALQKRWESRQSEMIVIYGRRRVGKTELIRTFAKNKKVLFSVGSRSDKRSQIHHFLKELSLLMDDSSLSRLPIYDWDTVFEQLDNYIKKCRKKVVVVFDEFQWLVESSPEIPSLLQKWWDTNWSKNGKVVIIICGSYLGFMEREVLGNKSPLFGRKTGLIRLFPLSFYESRDFHVNLTLKEQMKRYLICGGIPAYHKLFRKTQNLSEDLISLFFDIDSPLAKEADFLLMEELRDPKIYFSIMENLGQSQKTVTDLAQLIGVDRTRLPYYTKNLIELDYVEKRSPFLTFKDISERKVVYRIKDFLLRFWFAFVYPNLNAIERMDAKVFFASVISPQLDSFFGKVFEDVAAQMFVGSRMKNVSEPWRLGAYWDKTMQIDFVCAMKSGFSYLGEVKWNKIGKETVNSFTEKLKPLAGQISYRQVMISMEPINKNIIKHSNIDIYYLEELLKL